MHSGGKSWIEASRPLPAENLHYIAARFCKAQPILLQVRARPNCNFFFVFCFFFCFLFFFFVFENTFAFR